jgi:hypothetical protein
MNMNLPSPIGNNYFNYINSWLMESKLIALAVIIIIIIVLISSLGDSDNDESGYSDGSSEYGNSNSTRSGTSGSSTIFYIILYIIIILIILKLLSYFFNINILDDIYKYFYVEEIKEKEEKKLENDSTPVIIAPKQVFNIPGNNYTYDDAKALCSAYGSRLAKYEEIEKDYNKGAEWCNYGWSDNQNVLFPTQKVTYDNLQKIAGHENDCGRPGINGGYMANPANKYGVNCYGNKPKITNEEAERMANISPYPKTVKDIEMEERVNYWKGKLSEVLVSPFNYTKWSRL